jgi:uncharacterized membrane protein HdeD (DUF308 family)
MATSSSIEGRGRHESRYWGWPMVIGILLIIGGAFALYASVLTSFISAIYIGAMLMVVGVLEIISGFRMRHTQPFLVYLLAGVLALVVGFMFLEHPETGILAMSLLVCGYLFASGLFRGVTSIAERYPRWGWDLAYGVLSIALGIYILRMWPIASFYLLGTLVAIEIIARGVSLVAASWVIRDVQHHRLAHGFA